MTGKDRRTVNNDWISRATFSSCIGLTGPFILYPGEALIPNTRLYQPEHIVRRVNPTLRVESGHRVRPELQPCTAASISTCPFHLSIPPLHSL
ncbi:hypothetical protein E2C01_054094 [Portunus trituberculatus]|uniref:Uncharacterized protein n=1 Tax=Portunus trituberculatus TaxID=210409 RepID=A0A5B7GST0_PORTR|nr:hypothetical protein [Portunus trituberculatus]